MTLAQVAPRSKAPEDREYNLPTLEKQKDDRKKDEWTHRQTDGRKDKKENTKEKMCLFALLVFIKLATCPGWCKTERKIVNSVNQRSQSTATPPENISYGPQTMQAN